MRKVCCLKSHNKTKIIQKFQNILAGNQTLSLALSLGEGKLAHRKTKGFTLAEVLITLGIIGVVAAMTIPTLIANAQKHSAVTGLIEADSIINQAIRSSMYDTDESGAGELDTSLSIQEFAEKYFTPYLKVARICTKMSDGCWKTENFNGYYDLAGTKVTDSVPYSLVLTNGMIFGFSKIDGYNLTSIVVDINGKSRKNTLGKDVFVFYVMNSNNLCGGAKSNGVANGVYPGSFDNCGTPHVSYSVEDLTKKNTSVFRACSKTGTRGGATGGKRTGIGSGCAAVIYKNGWKMPANYPW